MITPANYSFEPGCLHRLFVGHNKNNDRPHVGKSHCAVWLSFLFVSFSDLLRFTSIVPAQLLILKL